MSVSYGGDSITFADGSVNSSGFIGHRNRIINGAMVIDQRNPGASVTPTDGAYTLDRWNFSVSQTSKLTTQQNAGAVTPPAGFSNYLGITSSSAYTLLAGDYFTVAQKIEGFNFADMAWGTASAATVTLSFWVRSSLTGTFGGTLNNSVFNRNYPFTYTISLANTWEQKSVTIAGDTSGTWVGATNGIGVNILFGIGIGSTYSGTSGAWTSSTIFAPTGATSVVGTSGATFYITGVQLERGSTASSFEYRPYGTELALCQRYYEKSYSADDVPGTASRGSVASFVTSTVNGYIYGFCSYKVQKRAKPTVTIYSYSGTAGFGSGGDGTNLAANALSVANETNFSGTNGFLMQNNSGGTITPTGNNVLFNWVASIEL